VTAQNHLILENAEIILADEVIANGWIAVVDGAIVEIGEGAPPERGDDLMGDLVIPGLIELHTDHIEAHYVPRPKVTWDPIAAVLAYDAQIAASGITTVLDSLRIWDDEGVESANGRHEVLADAIGVAREADGLRADHLLHLRCEIPTQNVVRDTEKMTKRSDVRLISLMDHTPGQRQFRDAEKLKTYYRGKTGGMTDADLEAMFEERRRNHALYAVQNRRALVELAVANATPMASHDDTTLEHVVESIADGVAIAEFPTTIEAAEASHASGIKVLMGAPNLVRGGSHSGNVSTIHLAEIGLLDILSSDYVPSSLLMGALQLPKAVPGVGLPAAIRTVTKTPAEAIGLQDRGEIAIGKRADLVRIRYANQRPVVGCVWRCGQRVV
jgi:alpha-D-ribose 1-methylphosphonate 5-triphosphate diphosphatase